MNLSNHAETGQIPKPYRRGSWRPIGEDEYIKMLHARVLDNNTHHEQQQQLLMQQQQQQMPHLQHLPSHNICCYCNNNANELQSHHNNNNNNNNTTATHRHNNNNSNNNNYEQQQQQQQQLLESQQQQLQLLPQQLLQHHLQLSTSSLTHTSCCAMLHLCARHSMCATPPDHSPPAFTAPFHPLFFGPHVFCLALMNDFSIFTFSWAHQEH